MLKIIKYPNEFLRGKTREVKVEELNDPKVQRLILDMAKTMRIQRLVFDMAKTMDVEKGVGLAAPQVGSDLRICVIRIDGEAYIFINPKIKSYSRKKDVFEEGCLSFPGKFFPVERPIKVKVQARDMEGKKVKIKADGLLARVLQHEIDHLEGILLIDRAKMNEE
ncbi:MAG: peptide deformylase [Candidatus Moranbacteria bacterium]|nr:peptide deformylase [Candidatus Moranbacteria bacterium]